jgi:Amylo-alpha-1,6-glucosidase
VRTVLIYGKDEILVMIRQIILENAGFQVFPATTFDSALFALVNERIDLLLLCQSLDDATRKCIVEVARTIRPKIDCSIYAYNGHEIPLEDWTPTGPDADHQKELDKLSGLSATVWAWLIGPFFDAWRRAYPGDTTFRFWFLNGIDERLNEGCVGTLSEIFDAEPPFSPPGCIAQAWSVAEMLRCKLVLQPDRTRK